MVKHPLHNTWCYIRFAQLQLDMWQHDENLSDHCLAIVCEHRQEVMQCNDEASRSGIKPGIALADAWLLCENLEYQLYQPNLDQNLLEAQTLILYPWFADICVDSRYMGVWIQLHSQQQLYKNEVEVEHRLHELLANLTYTIAFASNPSLAKLGVDDRHQLLLDAAQGVPIQYADLSPELEQKLMSMGLATLDKVLRIPIDVLGKKLGHEVVQWCLNLTGRSTLNLHFFHPQAIFYRHRQLNAEITAWEGVRFVLKSLLETLETFLRNHQKSTQQVSVLLFSRGSSHNPANPPSLPHPGVASLDITMARPCTSSAEMFNVMQLQMEAFKFPGPITDVALQVSHLETLRSVNSGFWADQFTDDGLSTVLNRLQAKLGSKKVQRLAPQSGWLPELQQICTDSGATAGHQALAAATWVPLWLVTPQPIYIETWQVQGQPQRLVVPWWLAPSQSLTLRDYWLAQDGQGRYGWVYFEFDNDQGGCWYLQGWVS